MTAPENDPVHTETYTLDIIGYQIRVFGEASGFWSAWACGKCLRASAKGRASATLDDAIRSARSSADRHHARDHAEETIKDKA